MNQRSVAEKVIFPFSRDVQIYYVADIREYYRIPKQITLSTFSNKYIELALTTNHYADMFEAEEGDTLVATSFVVTMRSTPGGSSSSTAETPSGCGVPSFNRGKLSHKKE